MSKYIPLVLHVRALALSVGAAVALDRPGCEGDMQLPMVRKLSKKYKRFPFRKAISLARTLLASCNTDEQRAIAIALLFQLEGTYAIFRDWKPEQ